jgi:predicted amino acid racemase
MAILTLNKTALQHNYNYLVQLLAKNHAELAIVSKILCGTKSFVKEIIELGVQQICDSRISNLELVKKIQPNIQTIYIKPPAKRSIPRIVKFADISCNSELQTIRWINEEAKKQGKVHRILIMVEMGDLREGVMGENLIRFYQSIFELEHIHVIGLGTNLNCLHGVMPSHDKLTQLGLYKQLIEAKFGKKLALVSGGTSVVIPLLFRNQIPKSTNHFRVGETLYFGNDLFTNKIIDGMRQDVFELKAEIIEITEKPVVPNGNRMANPSGETFTFEKKDYHSSSYRALIDIGILDINADYLFPKDDTIEIGPASSDMLVVKFNEQSKHYKVGDQINFKIGYMAALRLLNSSYIEKSVIEDNATSEISELGNN